MSHEAEPFRTAGPGYFTVRMPFPEPNLQHQISENWTKWQQYLIVTDQCQFTQQWCSQDFNLGWYKYQLTVTHVKSYEMLFDIVAISPQVLIVKQQIWEIWNCWRYTSLCTPFVYAPVLQLNMTRLWTSHSYQQRAMEMQWKTIPAQQSHLCKHTEAETESMSFNWNSCQTTCIEILVPLKYHKCSICYS